MPDKGFVISFTDVTAEREAAITGGVSLAFSFHGRVDEPRFVQPALVVGYNALDRNLDATLALLQDRLLECDLDDEDRLHDIIIQRRARLAQRVEHRPRHGGRPARRPAQSPRSG